MKKSVTLKDIAEKIGVSAVTVSKALTNKDGVSEEVRKKIKVMADEMGYKYDNSGNSSGQSGIVGIIVEKRFMKDNSDTFYLKMYQVLVQALARHHYFAILEIISFENEDNLVLPKLFNDNKVDGIVVLGQFKSPYISMLADKTENIVLLDFYDRNCNIDAVISDSVYGSYRATNYLIQNGHTKIGFLGSKFATSSIMDRYIGYYKANLEANLVIKDSWVIEDRNENGEYVPFLLPDKDDMPTAFICSCDIVSAILIKRLQELGYKVPKDISVVGYDNFIHFSMPLLKLTTVEVDIDAMTELATEIIIKKIRGKRHCCGMKIVESKLIIRDSVKNILGN